MKKTLLLGIIAPILSTGLAHGATTVFGSNNDGLGGFTTGSTVPATATPIPGWTTETDALRFTNATTTDSGQVNSTLLKQYTLVRTPGSSYSITGVLDIVSTYAADNNRFGILLFATSSTLAGADSGLSLQHNIDNGAFRILSGGVNGSTLQTTTYSGLNNSDAIGTTFTYQADVAFVGSNIEIDFTLTDQDNFSQTLSATVLAADFTGDNFGFGTRGRVRNTDTRVDPFIYDAKSFDVSVIPEPSSAMLAGLLGTAAFLRRRR